MNVDIRITMADGDPETEAFEDKLPLPTRDQRSQ